MNMNFDETYRMFGYYTDQANAYDHEYQVTGREDDYVKSRQMQFLARFCERVLKEMAE